LRDATGKIQVYVQKNPDAPGMFELLEALDIGDIVGAKGELFKTRTGEPTIKAKEVVLLSKNLRPLPEKWHGLKDVETRFRQRYVDLAMSEDVKNIFLLRSQIISSIRSFLDKKGYLEVETPMMQAIPGGALAKPFVTHHNALETDLYLRVAPELYLKRLLVGGFEKVYELNRNFRNEGLSTRHNPEFTMLEVYTAYADYKDVMKLTQDLFMGLAKSVFGKTAVPHKDGKIDLKPPWKTVTFFGALEKKLKFDVRKAKRAKLEAIAKKEEVDISQERNELEIADKLFEKLIDPELINPTFVIDYPAGLCPLAKKKDDDPELTERFELFIAGQEIANAYTELHNPLEQRERFGQQARDVKRSGKDMSGPPTESFGGDKGVKIDEDFLRALEYGMPPAGGLGIGIDRLAMLFTNSDSIREVILFPQLRPEGK